jgi:hypothetical protein
MWQVQVTQTYSAAALRSDYTLLHYGFALDLERPLLAGLDHIAGFEYPDDALYCESFDSVRHSLSQLPQHLTPPKRPEIAMLQGIHPPCLQQLCLQPSSICQVGKAVFITCALSSA